MTFPQSPHFLGEASPAAREDRRSGLQPFLPGRGTRPVAANPCRVLIVDDSPQDREAYRQRLAQDQDHGYTFREAASGQEGLRLCRAEPPDCVLLDYSLPDITGLEFLACLREEERGTVTPVILFACPGSEAVGSQALKQGAQDFLVKEKITGPDLRRAVQGAMNKVAQCESPRPPRPPREQGALAPPRVPPESEDLYQLLVEGLTDCALFLLDADERIASWNAGAQRLLGYTAGEILGRPFARLFPETDVAQGKPARALATAAAQGRYEGEGTGVKKDGSPFDAGTSITALGNADGGLRGYAVSLRDIGDRKKAESSLRAENSRLRRVVEAAPVGIALVGDNGQVWEANDALLRMIGWTRAELDPGEGGGLNWAALTPPDSSEADLRAWEHLRRIQTVGPVEKELCHKDGRRVPVLACTARWRGEAPGEPNEHVAYFLDLTDKKRTEQALHHSEQTYRQLTEVCRDAILLSHNDRIVQINSAGLQLFAAACPERVLGKSLVDLVHPDCQAAVSEGFRNLPPRETARHFEAKIIRLDGTTVDVEIAAAPLGDPGGQTVQLVLRDQSDRKRAEQALRESDERLRFALRMAQMGAWAWDLVSNQFTWSAEYERLFGLEPGSSHGTAYEMEQRLHPEDRQSVANELTRAREDKTNLHQEFRVVWPNGGVHWLERKGRLQCDETGVPIRLLGVDMDITNRKQVENQLQFTLKQVRAVSAYLESVREEERTRIAREIHDELGQTLTGFKMELAWLKGRLAKEAGLKRLVALQEKVDEMSGLIDSTLQTVRRIAIELRPQILDDLGLVAALEWETKEFQKRTGIPCKVQLEDVELDRDRSTALFRICQEALTNVTRHAGASAVSVRMNKEGDDLVLEVHDNGKGIADKDLCQRHSFGLLGMRERAALEGGELQITGRPGKGTRVVVRLPL